MKQRNRLISAVLAVFTAVLMVLPFNALPASADTDNGTVVTLSHSASSNASDFYLDGFEDQYGEMLDIILDGVNQHQERIYIYDYRILPEQLTQVIDYLRYYEQCFFINPQYVNYTWDGTYVYEFLPEYDYTADEIALYTTQLTEKFNSVLSKASQLGTNVEKLLYIHNYLVNNITYDSVGNLDQNNAYGAMVLNCSMCEGYAGSFAYMANQLGIPTYVISSVGIGHAWNVVLLDGYYYHVDCTWDDPTVTNVNLISNPLSGYVQNCNFLCSDAEIVATGHKTTDWKINGVSVYGIAANSTMYSSFELKAENTASCYSNGAWYYAINGKSYPSQAAVRFEIIKLVFVSNDVYIRYHERQIYTCFTLSNGYYSMFYSTLQEAGGNIYYSTASGIYRLVPGESEYGNGDVLILRNTVDNNIYDFDIDTTAGTFSVAYGKNYLYNSTNETVITYNIADYFCNVDGHTFSATVVTDLTDYTDEVVLYTCELCGTGYTEVIFCKETMLGFFYSALNSRTTDSNYNATADVNHDGFVNVRDYALIVNYEYINELNWQGPTTHEHSPVVMPAVAPTCTETGLTEGSFCALCGEVLVEQTVVPTVAHTWGAGTLTPASSGSPGVMAYICTVCGTGRTEIATGWQIYNGNTYFYDDDGYALTGFRQIGSTTYYFNVAGVMQTGWQQIGSNLYYFDSQGAMKTGWLSLNGTWYYFNSSGVMQTGLQEIGTATYYFDSQGAMQTGWQQLNGNKYYFTSSGAMAKGLTQIGSATYYFNSSGVMQTGWQKINNYWYYFNTDGTMKTGWLKDGNYWYYLDSDGKMLANTSRTINGKTYNFNSSGVCTNP